jgi:hypothetical protein
MYELLTGWIYFLFTTRQPPPQLGQDLLIQEYLDQTQRRITVGRTPLDE